MILKTLEEPPEGTVFFLAGVESGLLPTVRSRCTAVRVPLMTQEAIEARLEEGGINPAQARRVAGACGGSLDAALNMADGGSAPGAVRRRAQHAVLCAGRGAFIQRPQGVDGPGGPRGSQAGG